MSEMVERQEYQPEAGQMCFGQPWQRYEGSDLLDAAVGKIAREWQRVIWNRLQKEVAQPFNNSGASFETEGLMVRSYSWDESEEQPWNLKCGEIEISWYKHWQRGLSVNRPMTNDDIAAFLDCALAALSPCDTGFDYEQRSAWKPFTYNNVLYDEVSYEDRAARIKLNPDRGDAALGKGGE